MELVQLADYQISFLTWVYYFYLIKVQRNLRRNLLNEIALVYTIVTIQASNLVYYGRMRASTLRR